MHDGTFLNCVSHVRIWKMCASSLVCESQMAARDNGRANVAIPDKIRKLSGGKNSLGCTRLVPWPACTRLAFAQVYIHLIPSLGCIRLTPLGV